MSSDHIQLVTADRPYYLALKGSNVSTSTTASPYVLKYATATRPASASGSAIVSGAMNYLKVSPRITNVGTSSIRVIGWVWCGDSLLWIPNLITDVTCTLDVSSGATINGTASMMGCSSFTRATGDCKIFNATSLGTTGFFIVDTVGFDLVELAFRTTGSTPATANAHIGDI